MSIYTDIKHLREKGIWPDGEEPEWALKYAEKMDCSSTHAAVIIEGLTEELEKTRKDFKRVAEWAYAHPPEGEYDTRTLWFDQYSNVDKILREYV